MPRLKFAPSHEQRNMVQAMAGYGVKHEDICRVIINPESGKPIDDKTLRKVFRIELDNGTVIANSKVAESLYRKAIGDGRGAVAAAIFWLKTRAGWKETQVHEHTGKDGGPIEQQTITKEDLAEAVKSVRDEF